MTLTKMIFLVSSPNCLSLPTHVMTSFGLKEAAQIISTLFSWRALILTIISAKLFMAKQKPEITMRGQHAAGHFTYRAVQAVKSLISKPVNQSQDNNAKSNHRNCPQTQYRSQQRRANQRLEQPGQSQRANFGHQSVGGAQGARYSDIVKGKNNYSVPVGNRFEVLGN